MRPGQTPEGRLKSVIAKLGDKLEPTLARLKAGESKNRVAADLGINPRWLGFLNPLLEKEMEAKARAAAAKEQAREESPNASLAGEPLDEPRVEVNERSNMATMRQLNLQQFPLTRRVKRLIALAKSENDNVALKAIEMLNEYDGLIPSKVAVEPDPPPLFKLPEHSMPTLKMYEEWVKEEAAKQLLERVEGPAEKAEAGSTAKEKVH